MAVDDEPLRVLASTFRSRCPAHGGLGAAPSAAIAQRARIVDSDAVGVTARRPRRPSLDFAHRSHACAAAKLDAGKCLEDIPEQTLDVGLVEGEVARANPGSPN